MSDLDKNIHRKDESFPYDKIIVNPIEKDKKGRQESYTGLKSSTRIQIFATLMDYVKKLLTASGLKEENHSGSFNQKQLPQHLSEFKSLLVLLSLEDQSHNPAFAEQLSQAWNSLVNEWVVMSSSEMKEKIKFFISQIQNFPKEADHTLGYYFTEYAGKDWIPFPFMKLLQDLHNEYQASPVISVLQGWISLIDTLLPH